MNKTKALLLQTLNNYSEILSNRTCTDWKFPEDWTQEQVNTFVGFFTYANRPDDPKGDGEDYSEWAKNRCMPEGCMVAVLAYLEKLPMVLDRVDEIMYLGKEEGDKCGLDGCDGIMGYPPSENCSCHICAPCSSCVDVKLTCQKCGRVKELPY